MALISPVEYFSPNTDKKVNFGYFLYSVFYRLLLWQETWWNVPSGTTQVCPSPGWPQKLTNHTNAFICEFGYWPIRQHDKCMSNSWRVTMVAIHLVNTSCSGNTGMWQRIQMYTFPHTDTVYLQTRATYMYMHQGDVPITTLLFSLAAVTFFSDFNLLIDNRKDSIMTPTVVSKTSKYCFSIIDMRRDGNKKYKN